MSKNIAFVVSAVIVAMLIAVVFFVFQKDKLFQSISQTQSNIKSPQKTPPQPTSSPKEASKAPSSLITTSELEEFIEDSVNFDKLENLEEHMKNPLDLILMSTECCGESSPEEAINQLESVASGVPFSFDQESETIVNLKENNARLFAAFIGISQGSNRLVAFTINNDNKISAVEISVSWELYDQ